MTDVLTHSQPIQPELAANAPRVGELMLGQLISDELAQRHLAQAELLVNADAESRTAYRGIDQAVDHILGLDNEGNQIRSGEKEVKADQGTYKVERIYEKAFDSDDIKLSFTPDDPKAPRQLLRALGPMRQSAPSFTLTTTDPNKPATPINRVQFSVDWTNPQPKELTICKQFAFTKVLPAFLGGAESDVQ